MSKKSKRESCPFCGADPKEAQNTFRMKEDDSELKDCSVKNEALRNLRALVKLEDNKRYAAGI